jgi:hypothetical protein
MTDASDVIEPMPTSEPVAPSSAPSASAPKRSEPVMSPKPASRLTNLEARCLAAVEALGRDGLCPTEREIAAAVPGVRPSSVRQALARLEAKGRLGREPDTFVGAILEAFCAAGRAVPRAGAGDGAAVDEHPGFLPPPVGPNVGKAYNVALLRIVDGRGALYENLHVLTGLSVDSLKSRVKRARWDYPDGEEPAVLDGDEKRALSRFYRNSDDPAVRDFLVNINAPPRKRPDWRSSAGEAPKRGKSRRPRRASA